MAFFNDAFLVILISERPQKGHGSKYASMIFLAFIALPFKSLFVKI